MNQPNNQPLTMSDSASSATVFTCHTTSGNGGDSSANRRLRG